MTYFQSILTPQIYTTVFLSVSVLLIYSDSQCQYIYKSQLFDKRQEQKTSSNFDLFSNFKTSTIKFTKYFLTYRLGKSFIFTNLKVQMSLETQNAIINEAKLTSMRQNNFIFTNLNPKIPWNFN